MAWIKTIDPAAATGPLKAEYDEAMRRAGRVYHVLRLQSLNPRALRACIQFYVTLMFGPSELSRVQRELLATVVSSVNRCHY
jgi:uncharacterized peroxidase-related enzyme